MKAEVNKYRNGSVRIKITHFNPVFFNSEDYIIKTFDNGFSISKPNLGYVGKTYKSTRKKDDYITISTSKEIEIGTYYLDEDSNEDISFFIKSDYLIK